MLLDSRAKTALLAEALASQTSSQAKLQELHGRAAEAERMHAATQRQLRRVDAELAAVRAERLNLESELASVQAIAAGEISALEEARAVEVRAARGGYASPLDRLTLTPRTPRAHSSSPRAHPSTPRQVGKLLAVARAREAELEAQRSTLDQQRSSSSQAAVEAEAAARAERKRGEEARGELWQRLKRQAVMQAAEARELQQSLSFNRGEAEAARQAAAQEAHHLRHALSQSDVRLVEVSNHLRSAEEAHVRQLVLTGVIATKHGRKGKPHPRHVRVSQSLRRLAGGGPTHAAML